MNSFTHQNYLRPLSCELLNANFGDKRLSSRLGVLANSLSRKPGKSIPQACVTEAAREGAYRFLGNESVNYEAILEPHVVQTCKRASKLGECIVIHDTTECGFSAKAPREGLGWLRSKKGKKKGFFGHFSFVVSGDQRRVPLGVVACETLTRNGEPKNRKKNKTAVIVARNDSTRESLRWGRGVKAAEARLGKGKAIHVMDREADFYEAFAQVASEGTRCVIRLAHDRELCPTDGVTENKLFAVMEKEVALLNRTVTLSARGEKAFEKQRRILPVRRSRIATLSVSATCVTIKRPEHADKTLTTFLQLNVVRVFEEYPPDGQPAVEWKLITTEPIETVGQVEKIVDIYKTRWVIEEFNKALKTGCGYENLQLESKKTLLNALAVMIPVAWRLLLLRSLGRFDPDAPAEEALTKTQIQVLRSVAEKPLPKQLNVYHAMMAVAALGGHIKNNGAPGWIVLGRGFNDLLLLETGWLAARAKM